MPPLISKHPVLWYVYVLENHFKWSRFVNTQLWDNFYWIILNYLVFLSVQSEDALIKHLDLNSRKLSTFVNILSLDWVVNPVLESCIQRCQLILRFFRAGCGWWTRRSRLPWSAWTKGWWTTCKSGYPGGNGYTYVKMSWLFIYLRCAFFLYLRRDICILALLS